MTKQQTSTEIRQAFLDYFKERAHTIVPSASLVPQAYGIMLDAAGIAWIAAFAMFLFEYGPMLLGPRRERGSAG